MRPSSRERTPATHALFKEERPLKEDTYILVRLDASTHIVELQQRLQQSCNSASIYILV